LPPKEGVALRFDLAKMSSKALTSPEFIKALALRSYAYLIGADRFKGVDGKRFGKDIVSDPLFVAIVYHRRWAEKERQLEEFLSGTSKAFRQKIRASMSKYYRKHSRLLSKELLRAVGKGETAAIAHLAELLKLYEMQGERRDPKARKGDPVRWHFFMGICAVHFLTRGVVPTKKAVKEAAFKERAVWELEAGASPEKIACRISELREHAPTHWARIFKELGLSSLPSAPTHH
jgi:hypothetical protein